MKLYGLIGYPLSHSFSKNYFTQKFIREGLQDCVYELFPVEQIELVPQLIASHPHLCGLNVTIPYKEQVVPYLHETSDAVKEIRAVNCIKIDNGRLTGYNTDVVGFEQSLLPLLRPHHTKALVLGTGGAAKAVAWVLKKLGIEFSYVSRKKAEGILSYDDLNAAMMAHYPLIINTTPLGMQPNVDARPSLPYEGISSLHLCYDLVYNPEKTVFLQMAEQQGAVIKNGLQMLELQAEEGWKIWNL
ncbi:MAG: shikimate dehydrogenase [Chitinophagaceae bacterium]|nr:shikimate dehydrogenase [Chitinophagaceae bacterium]